MTFNKKDKLLFWNGALVAMVGGAVGNFWVSSYFNMIGQNYSWLSILTFGVFSLFFIFIVVMIARILKRINKITRGRPKSIKNDNK
jgi:uncharacterized membrane protein